LPAFVTRREIDTVTNLGMAESAVFSANPLYLARRPKETRVAPSRKVWLGQRRTYGIEVRQCMIANVPDAAAEIGIEL
jgi:hypothetical protein